MSTTPQLTQPPVMVAYDVLQEASNRLQGRLLALEAIDPRPDARERVLAACAAVQDRVAVVHPADRAAIAALDAELRAELSALPRP